MKRNPDNQFTNGTNPLDFKLLDFWQWNQSNLLSNNLRGHLAEFIVMKALGIESEGREEWASYDLITKEGIRIEIKSAGYIQAWYQKKPSVIQFGIAETLNWNKDTGQYDNVKQRQSDVYVFCVFEPKEKENANPLDLDKWTFYILPTKVLNEKLGKQKSISLSSLLKLEPRQCTFDKIATTIYTLYTNK